jgi:hypothetical protein
MMRTNAPVAVSDDLQQYVRFSSGRKDSSLRLEACIPLYEICGNSNDGSPRLGGLISDFTDLNRPYARLGSTGGIYGQNVDNDSNYISPVFLLIGSSFVRYKVEKLSFIYEPQSTTTVADRLVFAYANDPNHPLITDVNTNSANQENLLALSDSVAFAPWRSWTLDVSSEVTQNMLYTYDQSQGLTDNRFTLFGSIGCVASKIPTSELDPPIYGILYAKIAFEYIEFCPIVRGITPAMLKHYKAKGFRARCLHEDCKSCTKPCKAESTVCKKPIEENRLLKKAGSRWKTNQETD